MTILSVVQSYWMSLTAFGLFGVLHSLGAQERFKEALAQWAGQFFVDHFWRLLYCLISYLWFYKVVAFLHWGLHPGNDFWLGTYPEWLWQAVTLVHLGSIALLYAAFLQCDYLEFLGLRQAWRGFKVWIGRPEPLNQAGGFGTHYLEVRGVYGWVRHPMLVGGLLFLITSGSSLNNLVFTFMYVTYMLIGCYYEERRLIRIFGQEYLEYCSRIGAYLHHGIRRYTEKEGGDDKITCAGAPGAHDRAVDFILENLGAAA